MTRPRLREAFPADDPVARWMFVGFQWMSDLWTLEATASDLGRAQSADALLLFRLVLSRLYEGHRLIRDARAAQEVLSFIQGLPPEAVAAFDQLEAHYEGRKSCWASRVLKPGRDLVSHYSAPESDELKARLERFADAETIFVADERTGRVRFKTADAAVLADSLGVPDEELATALRELLEGVERMRRYAVILFDHAQRTYFHSRGISPGDVRELVRREPI